MRPAPRSLAMSDLSDKIFPVSCYSKIKNRILKLPFQFLIKIEFLFIFQKLLFRRLYKHQCFWTVVPRNFWMPWKALYVPSISGRDVYLLENFRCYAKLFYNQGRVASIINCWNALIYTKIWMPGYTRLTWVAVNQSTSMLKCC